MYIVLNFSAQKAEASFRADINESCAMVQFGIPTLHYNVHCFKLFKTMLDLMSAHNPCHTSFFIFLCCHGCLCVTASCDVSCLIPSVAL